MSKLQTMTVQEVCQLLKVNRHKLYEIINGGELGAIKVGKSYRILADSLEEYYTRNLVA